MVRIRLRRRGAKKQPTYRFVVAMRERRATADSSKSWDYNPRTEPRTVVVDERESGREWVDKGGAALGDRSPALRGERTHGTWSDSADQAQTQGRKGGGRERVRR